jgi:hypothetical protein
VISSRPRNSHSKLSDLPRRLKLLLCKKAVFHQPYHNSPTIPLTSPLLAEVSCRIDNSITAPHISYFWIQEYKKQAHNPPPRPRSSGLCLRQTSWLSKELPYHVSTVTLSQHGLLFPFLFHESPQRLRALDFVPLFWLLTRQVAQTLPFIQRGC